MQFFPATSHPSQRGAQKSHGKKCDAVNLDKERKDKEVEEKEEQNQGYN